MSDIKTALAEMFGFQLFENDEELQNMIDDTVSEYDDDLILSVSDLDAAAGGFEKPLTGSEGSGKK